MGGEIGAASVDWWLVHRPRRLEISDPNSTTGRILIRYAVTASIELGDLRPVYCSFREQPSIHSSSISFISQFEIVEDG
jgi:hypothetical protein